MKVGGRPQTQRIVTCRENGTCDKRDENEDVRERIEPRESQYSILDEMSSFFSILTEILCKVALWSSSPTVLNPKRRIQSNPFNILKETSVLSRRYKRRSCGRSKRSMRLCYGRNTFGSNSQRHHFGSIPRRSRLDDIYQLRYDI